MSILRGVRRVVLSLTNQCNMAKIHEDCPAHYQKAVIELPDRIIDDVLGVCREEKFEGAFAFHLYSEVLGMERFYEVAQRTIDTVPTTKGIMCWTNGTYLDQACIDRLRKLKVFRIHVSFYTQKEMVRLTQLILDNPGFSWGTTRGIQTFDDRMTYFSSNIERETYLPCHAPLNDITITESGNIAMCCITAWKDDYNYGSLLHQGFRETMEKARPAMESLQARLVSGKRDLKVCKACVHARAEDPTVFTPSEGAYEEILRRRDLMAQGIIKKDID